MFIRSSLNPLISPKDARPSRPDFEVIGTFNAGACSVGDDVVLLLRVAERPINEDKAHILYPYYADGEMQIHRIRRDDPDWNTSDARQIQHRRDGRLYLTSISHLRLARSKDGVHFDVDAMPWLSPEGAYESFGVEDARITRIEDRYYVNYTAVSPFGIATGLVSTPDFVSIERHGLLFSPSNRDVTLFPTRVNGQYVCYHRPMPGMLGGMHIWMATSPDLRAWGNHRVVLTASDMGWMNGRVGGGAPPILTDAGWLSIFHAADSQDRYSLGAFLAAPDDPSRILAVSAEPIFKPEAVYETDGFFGNVVFTCGVVQREKQLLIYYGAADEHIALATVDIDALIADLLQG